MIIDKLLMNNDWFITLDGKVVAEVGEGTEEFAEDIARSVQANIDHLVYDNEVVDIKNDDDKLGIIIDVLEDSTLEGGADHRGDDSAVGF